MEINEKEKLVLTNIEQLMRANNIPNGSALAAKIGVKPTSYYTFTRHPLSSSKIKSKICEYFNISVDTLESVDLSKEDDLKRYIVNDSSIKWNSNNHKSITSLQEYELNRLLINNKSSNQDIINIKKRIAEKYLTNFNRLMAQADKCFREENYDGAFSFACSAFYMLKEEEIECISQYDLELYIKTAEIFGNNETIQKLLDVLLDKDNFNQKVVIVLANLLEANHADLARICYEYLENSI